MAGTSHIYCIDILLLMYEGIIDIFGMKACRFSSWKTWSSWGLGTPKSQGTACNLCV